MRLGASLRPLFLAKHGDLSVRELRDRGAIDRSLYAIFRMSPH